MNKQVAEFTINYIQYLDPNGNIVQDLPKFAADPKKLIHLYRIMVLTRAYDTKAIALQRTGKMGTYASTLGQEAIGAALGDAMKKEDVLCPFYRDYAAQIQRDISPSEIYAYWGGDERGSCFANNKEDLPICVPIGTQCLHAAGIAYAFKYRKQPRVAVTVCGDGGTSQGDFYEAMNVSGDWKLPVVFIVNNNQWAISVPRRLQTGALTLAQKAIAAGFDGIQIDGNDVIACREVIANAIEKARRGEGPTLIEAITYRLCDHTTADDANRYRDKSELEQAWQREPISRLRSYLENINQWSKDNEENLQKECAQSVDKAVQTYLNMPHQPTSAIFDYMYAKWPDNLKEQRDYALALDEQFHEEGSDHA